MHILISWQQIKLLLQIGCIRMRKTILFLLGLVIMIIPNIDIKQSQESLMETDALAVLVIPTLEIRLPIYSGTDDRILEMGVGLVEGSDMFGEGKNTHSVLAGHRGIPNRDLFLNLGEVKVGDDFQIEADGVIFQYRITDIYIINPEETQSLQVQEERELVSLVTCTPYGINTKRLIVRGERKEVK